MAIHGRVRFLYLGSISNCISNLTRLSSAAHWVISIHSARGTEASSRRNTRWSRGCCFIGTISISPVSGLRLGILGRLRYLRVYLGGVIIYDGPDDIGPSLPLDFRSMA